jgi:hypothetical protein
MIDNINIDNISNNINKMFQTLFKSTNDNKEHVFFKDLKKVYKIAPNYRKMVINNIKKRINYKVINNIPIDIKIEPKYEELNKDEIKKLSIDIHNILNYNKILELVSYMSKFIIKSNIIDKDKIYKKIAEDKKDIINNNINIMIIGSGPVGLFLACYLYLYYNDTSMNSVPRVNIVMYDSKVDKPGFRKPYNRQRLFATASKYLSLILPKVYCWDDSKDYFMINIFLLEYVLFALANQHYHIPMIYEDYDWEDYKKIIDKGKFDVVFDCTGGRLKHEVIKNVDATWLKDIKLSSSYIDKKIIVKEENNLVLIENDSEHIVNYFFGSIEFYNNDKTVSFHSNYDIDIMNKQDLIYLNKIKDKYFTYEDALILVQGIKDSTYRDYLYTILNNNKTDRISLLVKFDVWAIYMRHQIKISDTFIINKRKILLIGAGDTIFHSHFITGSGLNRIFDFTVKCANQLDKIIINSK